ncbi:MAG: GerMN domain-containing protein [Acidimicrobiales bacterium]
MRAAVTVIAAAVLLGACGLPKDSSPRVITADKVPFSLLGPSTTKPGDSASNQGTQVQVWYLAGGRLQAVTRTVDNGEALTTLEALVKGVAVGDPPGISSAIPENTAIVSATLDGDVLTVTLSKEIVAVSGAEQKQAFAQLVYTATGTPGVAGVRFKRIDDSGQSQDLEPTTDTGNKQGPLMKSDFNTLAPNR